MKINPHMEALPDFPFDRLRKLLVNIQPPDIMSAISLAVGEPQNPTPEWVSNIIREHAQYWNKYPTSAGSPELRASIASWMGRRFGSSLNNIDPHANILACAGSREALYLLPSWLVPQTKNGKRPIVAMPNPFYHVYNTAALASGAEPLLLSASKKTGFLPDLDKIDRDDLDRLAVLFICSPANPQGTIASKSYLENAIKLARKYSFVLVADECYTEIYDAEPPPSVLQVCCDMGDVGTSNSGRTLFDNVIAANSLSKRSNAAGLRSGFISGDQAIIEGYGRFRSYISATVPIPIDAASSQLWSDDKHVARIRSFYRRNIDAAESVLGNRFEFYRPAGGFFLWLKVGDGVSAAKALWKEAGLRVLPGSFISQPDMENYNPGTQYIRIALVNNESTIKAACSRLVNVL